MSENQVVIYDILNGTSLERDITEEELQEQSRIALEHQERHDQLESARSSALAKLAALGLTEEEIAAL